MSTSGNNKSEKHTNLELIKLVDTLPYGGCNRAAYGGLVDSCYEFWLADSSTCVGWMLPGVVAKMPWIENEWSIDHRAKTITPRLRSHNGNERVSTEEQNALIERLVVGAKNAKSFEALRGFSEEFYPIYGSPNAEVRVRRAASALFGVVDFGVHLTAYVQEEDGLKIWVSRRSANKLTYPNMLDNSVAGGMTIGEKPVNAIIRETVEEASLPEELVRNGARACGSLSFFFHQVPTTAEPTGLLHPIVPYVFDLELPADAVLVPGDDEVKNFELFTVDEVKEALAAGEFRPGSTMVMMDFLVRHGIITPDNEPDYLDIVSRLHRVLPFPTNSQVSADKRG